MGVPIFCILLGIPLGYVLAVRLTATPYEIKRLLRDLLVGAALASTFTAFIMLLIWRRFIGMLFDSNADLVNFGIPQILYEPRASFVAWLLLMIVLSPMLQLLTTIFAAHVTLLHRL